LPPFRLWSRCGIEGKTAHIREESSVVKVLFVCTGNICRSPTAEGVFTRLVHSAGLDGLVEADSAGTHDYHVGEAPDPRSCAAARGRGVELGHLRARRVSAQDFRDFDLVIAMDRGHYRELSRICPPGSEHRLRLFLEFAPHTGATDVPDPYYGDDNGFERVLDLCEAAAAGLLDHVRRQLITER
jgi:protein-tyrosine phosphatase